jgi:hypothetical protein
MPTLMVTVANNDSRAGAEALNAAREAMTRKAPTAHLGRLQHKDTRNEAGVYFHTITADVED